MSTYPAWLAGMRVTAGRLNAMLPLESILAADSGSSISNTSLMDTGLTLDLAANASYQVLTTVFYVTPTAADIKTGYVIPSGASGRRGGNAPGTAAAAADPSSHRVWTSTDLTGISTVVAVGGVGATHLFYVERAKIDTVSAGTLKFQFAQVTSTATDSLILSGSAMVAKRTA